MNRQEESMKRTPRSRNVALAAFMGLLAVNLAAAVLAADHSSCITCHLDEAMLLKNLSGAEAKKSAMQSGRG
jgi:hypothetical protein